MRDFLDFLRTQVEQIKTVETQALDLLHQKQDAQAYEQHMRLKAKILANLVQETKPYMARLGADQQPSITQRLQLFSQSAQRSLDLDSVFYMSALLYPEDHQPGQPNTLELWLRDLETL